MPRPEDDKNYEGPVAWLTERPLSDPTPTSAGTADAARMLRHIPPPHTHSATGAIYAIRRSLFEPIPEDTLLDDVLTPLRVVRRGYRVVFEPDARAYDGASSTARQEFVRKTRTIAGTFQLMAREGWLLNPLRNRLWFETISHKVLRVALPMLHASVLASNIVLADAGFYGMLLALQLCFYTAAAVGLARRMRAGVRFCLRHHVRCACCCGRPWSASTASSRIASRSRGNAFLRQPHSETSRRDAGRTSRRYVLAAQGPATGNAVEVITIP